MNSIYGAEFNNDFIPTVIYYDINIIELIATYIVYFIIILMVILFCLFYCFVLFKIICILFHLNHEINVIEKKFTKTKTETE